MTEYIIHAETLTVLRNVGETVMVCLWQWYYKAYQRHLNLFFYHITQSESEIKLAEFKTKLCSHKDTENEDNGTRI